MQRKLLNIPGLIASTVIAGSAAAFVSLPLVASPAFAAEKAVAAEKNPPGDIPDSQIFITYQSKSGFSLKIPEGWARLDRNDGASFVDKLDGVVVTETADDAVPTVDSVKKTFIPNLDKQNHAVKLDKVEQIKLPAGQAIRIAFSSNSEPNSVTNKQVRLENEIYIYHDGGKTVSVRFYAPYGADNADQWNLMSRSFRWQ